MSFPDLLEEAPDLAEGIRGKLTPNQPLDRHLVPYRRTGAIDVPAGRRGRSGDS
jgi:UDP-N-acetylmuramate dehydrogenase